MKYWVTITEPTKICRFGYGGTNIPAINLSGIADYLCGHHVLLAHSKVYELYHREYNPQGNNGEILLSTFSILLFCSFKQLYVN